MKKTMNLKNLLAFTILGATIVTSFHVAGSSRAASTFDETVLDQNKVIAVARPYGDKKYDLLVIEQIPGKKQCWSEKGNKPILVTPLLLNFDFTGICRRSTDSNGYSVRIDGEDYGLNRLLRIVEKDNELLLVATSRGGSAEEIVIGRTHGLSEGFLKIQLEPSWRFTKRTFKGKQLGHFYFSKNNNAPSVSPSPKPSVSPSPKPSVSPSPKPSATTNKKKPAPKKTSPKKQ